ncbi:MAG: hypothetical protein PHO78_06180 [Methanomicrobium sp.]|nr:hypothetical protein [Methanomicrobium sp.]
MKTSEKLCTGKKIIAGEFEIIPVFRTYACCFDCGLSGSSRPAGLIFKKESECFFYSFESGDSWIYEFLKIPGEKDSS